jgi:hypothetical protein
MVTLSDIRRLEKTASDLAELTGHAVTKENLKEDARNYRLSCLAAVKLALATDLFLAQGGVIPSTSRSETAEERAEHIRCAEWMGTPLAK